MNFSLFALIPVIVVILSAVKVLKEYERGIVFRLGKALPEAKGPGLILLFPVIDRIITVDMRTVTMDVPPQDVITRDNVSVKVNAVVYFRALHPRKAVLEVENYLYATAQLAQTTMRSVCGQKEIDDLLTNREEVNMEIQSILDKQTDPWGVKVSLVEVKAIDFTTEMQRAMAKQAEAERERRAKVIHADGEFQAAQKLKDASDIIAQNPIALQLRYLQTLGDIATENNSVTIFPVPVNFFEGVTKLMDNAIKR